MRIRLWRAAAAVVVAVAAVWWLLPAADRPLWPPAALTGGNLLLVTIDTLRADRLSEGQMPNLARLGATGHVFESAYAHAPLTLPSHATMLTGLLPPAHGVRGNGAFRLDDARVTLAERLKASGYRTGAFVGAFVLDSRFGLAQGFDHYDGVADERAFAADFGFTERRAPEVLDAAAGWILEAASTGRPWFAWVHLFDPHAPYDAPDARGEGYDGEVRFVDRAFGQFLDSLNRRGAMGRTAIIVTADHGESLGEHGESTHGLFAYDATMRVPLIVAGPQLGQGRHDVAVGLIDLMPTALDLLGLEEDPELPGRAIRHLVAGAAAEPIYLEAMDGWLTAGAAPVEAVVHEQWKLIVTPIPELYDLDSDPGELRNRAGDSPKRMQEIGALVATLRASAAGSTSVVLDPAAEARLRSLGYASGAPRPRPAEFPVEDDPKRVLPLYERFLNILARNSTDVAALLEIVDLRPGFIAARLAAASILIETGRAPEAVALLESSAGGGLAVRERLGAAYLAAGKPDRAAAVLQPLVTDPSVSPDAWNALGVARAQLGQHLAARSAFDEASRRAPDAARILFNRALARLESGDRAGAAQELSDLTARHPDFADGWKVAATLRHQSGDRAAAVQAWQRALHLDPDDPDVMFNLAVTLRDLRRLDEARPIARRFLEVAPRPAYDREAAILLPLIR